MRYNVRITEGAEHDLGEIVAFLAESAGPAAAGRVLESLLEAAAALARYPERGSYPNELLRLGIREFRQVILQPYRTIYRVAGNRVFILLVADGRRDFQSLMERRVLKG